ncbi:methyl-accepting chemotaxis protein [Bacillus sp. RG28]|uniref:Methyl-accepting chemotaxis protein n=1 Tax=Gottfriedia endophytica TaxID=2820819 RepID=A0A940SKY0_9BACI|nr:methyl-accepting chemotaxis protein [Gottfriedia endophytica]MBP0726484.1 methyl-accepting chemotaxis protein [Gottfriedia endophytica]
MKLLKNLKIGNKLILLISISVIALIIVGFTGYKYMNTMAEKSKDMYNDRLLPVLWLGKISSNTRGIDEYTLELMLTSDESQMKVLQEKITQNVKEDNEFYTSYKNTQLIPEEKKLLGLYEENLNKLRESRKKVIELATENRNTEAYSLYSNQIQQNRVSLENIVDQLVGINQNLAAKLYKENQSDSKEAALFLVIIILSSVTLCILVGILITRLIVSPVKEIQNLMEKAEFGDFTIQGIYQSKDEIGLLTISLNNMIAGIREIIRTVHITSEKIAASSEELAANMEASSSANEELSISIQELSVGANEQAQSSLETSKIIIEIALGVNQVATNAKSVTNTTLQTSNKSIEGLNTIETSINQMNHINVNVTKLSDVILSLGNRSNEISKITKVISGITSQTNLLALNAAIEAARAGENGKGFSVVADEVRKLAEQSSKSSNQISELIFEIQEETNFAVKSMEETVIEVNNGISIVGTAGETFNVIQNSIQEISKQVEQVSVAMEQMAIGTEEVKEAINNVAQIAEVSAVGSQTVAASAEEMSASSEEITSSSTNLATIAEELQLKINKFKI